MPRVMVLYYSRTGNTRAMAREVAKGVRMDGVEVVLKEVTDTKPQELLEYDGLIIGSPTYYGAMAAEVKELLDASVKYHGKLAGKVGAAFSSSANIGGGNETTILSILQALLIHGMIIQGEADGDHYGPVSIGKPNKSTLAQCQRLGQKVAMLVKKLKG